MKLYTRRGDDGKTALFDGSRVEKSHQRVEAYGAVDELNACLGLAATIAGTQAAVQAIHQGIVTIQQELFSLGGELATPPDSDRLAKIALTTSDQAARLESWIDEACAPLAPLKTFVLPGGDPLAAQLHVCRTACRRAERAVVALCANESVRPEALVYLNRLSDLLFAWARLANHAAGVPDVRWENPKKGP